MDKVQSPASFDVLRTSIVNSSPQSASVVVPTLFEIVEPMSVIDFGCGVGAWLAEFKRLGVKDVLGLDTAEMLGSQSVLSSNEQRVVDLADVRPIGRSFDLALCLEVAEHLPSGAAETLVEALTDVAPVVAFSAAIPGQGGVCHLNEQWPDCWREIFAAHGFHQIDGLRSLFWNDSRVAWWYRQNLFLYSSRQLEVPGTPMAENVVHPMLWEFRRRAVEDRVRLADVSLGELTRAAMSRVYRALKTRARSRSGRRWLRVKSRSG